MTAVNRGALGAMFMFTIIISLAFAIPILIFGIAAIAKAINLMNKPIVEGQIPIWAIFAAAIAIQFIYRKYKEKYPAKRY